MVTSLGRDEVYGGGKLAVAFSRLLNDPERDDGETG
jgi:hypothetical protein